MVEGSNGNLFLMPTPLENSNEQVIAFGNINALENCILNRKANINIWNFPKPTKNS